MTYVTICTKSNPHVVNFEQPIRKPDYIQLLSCSFYNSWYNIIKDGVMDITGVRLVRLFFHPSHNTVESLAKEIEEANIDKFKDRYEFKTETFTPRGALKIEFIDKTDKQKLKLNDELSQLLGIDKTPPDTIYIKRLTSPSAYFIHCSLIDKEKNLFNGKPSSVLARFDVKGKPFENIAYRSEPNVLRDAMSDEYVNSFIIDVRDEHGKLFDFNGFPMKFELEII